jgi:glycerate dehydrogenase
MKIVVLDGYAVNPGDLSWDIIRKFGELEIYDYTAPEDTVSRLQGAKIALTNKTVIDAAVMDACPELKLICVLATGYNVVDCPGAKQRNIPICNVPAYGTDAVAQFTFALLLELCHQVGHHSKAVHDGRWCSNRDFCFWDTPQMELAGKTMGIIGFGRIGRAVGKIAKAMGMQVIAYNRSRCPEGEAIGTYVDLETLLRTADVISLHCPLTEENAGLINRDTLSMMKDGVILLNTARGPLLDEKAVSDALSSGKLRGAAVDVVSKEPMERSNPLLTAPNCIITPHMAWAPTESRQRILNITANSIAAFLEGKPINTVNM